MRLVETLVLGAVALTAAACATAPERPSPVAGAHADGTRSECAASPIMLADGHAGTVGQLKFVRGWELTGDRGFGGLSGLTTHHGELLAVSDAGLIIELTFRQGSPVCRTARLLDEHGDVLAGKEAADAEGVSWLGDGRVAISFEHDHRVQVFTRTGFADARPNSARLLPAGWPQWVADAPPIRPAGTEQLKPNQSFEALGGAKGGPLLMGAETITLSGAPHPVWRLTQPPDPDGPLTASDGPMFTIAAEPGYGLVGLSSEDDAIYVLRRFYAPGIGNRIAIDRLPSPHSFAGEGAAAPVEPELIARLTADSGLPVDNFEGIAVRPNGAGGNDVWIVSDDNFSERQRTLLYQFTLGPAPAA